MNGSKFMRIENVDVLYILGNGSKWHNNELRHSLRSLDVHGIGIDRVFIVGADPGFLSPFVEFHSRPDPACRACNHVTKVLWVCENTDISEIFVLMYDDVYFAKDVDLRMYPRQHLGRDIPEGDRGNEWRRSKDNARQILKREGKPITDWSVHCPTQYEKQKFINLKPIWEEGLRMQSALAVRSLYHNWYEHGGIAVEDCLIKNVNGIEDIEEQIGDREIFSIHDKSLTGGMMQYLEQRYSEPSHYELVEVSTK